MTANSSRGTDVMHTSPEHYGNFIYDKLVSMAAVRGLTHLLLSKILHTPDYAEVCSQALRKRVIKEPLRLSTSPRQQNAERAVPPWSLWAPIFGVQRLGA